MKRIVNPYAVKKRSNFRKIFNQKLILSILLIISSIIGITSAANYQAPAISKIPKFDKITNTPHHQNIILTPVDSIQILNDSIDSLQKRLVNEIHNYMVKVYPNTQMSAELITDICLTKNFDIPLLLSQAHLESHFGKRTGKTNSCFGVVKKRYSHVNESIDDYVTLMQRSYVRHRSVEACIRNNFNVEGSTKYRYAGNPVYGQTIHKIRSKIIRSTSITHYVNQINDLQEQIEEIRSRQTVEPIYDIDGPHKEDTTVLC